MQDLVVLGGGPAGAISALLAAREGLRVTLIDPDRPMDRLEGLSPRLQHWLHSQGLLTGFDGVIGPLARQVDWAGISESNREYVVQRGALDRHLRARAVQAGAVLLRGSGRPVPGGVALQGSTLLPARRVIDARGRSASRPDARAPATLALCAWVQAPALPPGIRLTAVAQGWVWRVALPDGRLWVQTLQDAAAPGRPEARLQAMLAAAEPDVRFQGLAGPVLARTAAPHLPAALEGDLTCLPVGDALAAMDPLSGHGQFWAVSSALAVAAVRRTLDARPDAADLCRRYLTTRAHDTAWHQARIGRDFLALEPRFADQPFWAARRGFPDDQPAQAPQPTPEIIRQPVIRDGLIAEMEVLRTPRSPGGIGWIGTIPAVPAFRCLSEGGEAALAAQYGPVAAKLRAQLDAEMVPR